MIKKQLFTENNEKVLIEFMNKFYGFGNLESPYWFIGIEEGGGNDIVEIEKRLSRWVELEKQSTIDNKKFHEKINDLGRFFDAPPDTKTQNTWKGIIAIMLGIKNIPLSIDNYKRYQSQDWGRKDSENCLLEMYPLPSPNKNEWKYNVWSTNPDLISKDIYKKNLKEKRICGLRNMMYSTIPHPRVVTLYSDSQESIEFWYRVTGINFKNLKKEIIIETSNGELTARFGKNFDLQTLFVLVSHPSVIRHHCGIEYFYNIGKIIAQKLSLAQTQNITVIKKSTKKVFNDLSELKNI